MDEKTNEVGMKILFSADWHIKLGQKNVPEDWQTNRYMMLFEKLHELEKNVDVHIIGGDIFDTLPKPKEIALYYDFIAGCKIPTFIYDGNHEATRKGKTFLHILSRSTERVNPNAQIINGAGELCIRGITIDFIPYTDLKTFNPAEYTSRICCTHVRGNIPPHVVEEVNLELFKRWDIVLAGDLHSYTNSQKNILYPGSPLTISFHRNPVENGVIVLDTNTLTHEFIPLGLPQLLRKTVSHKDQIIKTDYDHTIYEITGNLLELSDVDSTSELVDKKVISRSSEALLNLHNLSIEEELQTYLKNVIKLSSKDIQNTMRVFNDNYNQRSKME